MCVRVVVAVAAATVGEGGTEQEERCEVPHWMRRLYTVIPLIKPERAFTLIIKAHTDVQTDRQTIIDRESRRQEAKSRKNKKKIRHSLTRLSTVCLRSIYLMDV